MRQYSLGWICLDIWCWLDFALEMLYVARWRGNQMFYNVFMAPPPASNPLLCPGKCNEPRFNTRWPPGPWENVSDVSSFYLTFTFCKPGIAVKYKTQILLLSKDTKPSKLVETPLCIRNNGIFGNDGLQLFGKINCHRFGYDPKQASSCPTSSYAGVFWAAYFLKVFRCVCPLGNVAYCSW